MVLGPTDPDGRPGGHDREPAGLLLPGDEPSPASDLQRHGAVELQREAMNGEFRGPQLAARGTALLEGNLIHGSGGLSQEETFVRTA